MKKQPVLIFGPKKSGSSLFRQLLDGHSKGIVLPGEFPVKLFLNDRKYQHAFHAASDYLISNRDSLKKGYSEKFNDVNQSDTNPFELNRIPKDILTRTPDNKGTLTGLTDEEQSNLFDKENYHEELQKQLRNLDSVNDFIEVEAKALCAGLDKNYDEVGFIGLKEVGGAGQDGKHLFSFMTQSLNAKIIFIVRDPRGVLLSRINSDKKHYQFTSSFRRKRIMMQTTALLYRDMQKIQSTFGSQRVHVVKYEELVTNQDKVMKEVAQFLQIPFEEILLTPSILGFPKNVTTSIKLVESDKKDIKNKVFSDSVDKWKKGLNTIEKWLAESLNLQVLNAHEWSYKKTIPTPISGLGYYFYRLKSFFLKLIR